MELKNLFTRKKPLMVIDVEATCWETIEEQKSQPNEVIEIGYSFINEGIVSQGKSIIIKPEFSSLSQFCTKLTGITQEILDSGVNYKIGYKNLSKLITSPWASWGYYDYSILNGMCSLYKISNFIPSSHINIRKMFAEIVMKSDNPKTAPSNPKDAMSIIKMKWEGANHRGDSDAYNIARIYVELLEMKKKNENAYE